MNSPAWRTQRSLAIITFDEDAQDGQHPAQRVPTIVLGSQGVRRGATDATRYTHYSMLRTVEAALGTGTLTANDRYAPAFGRVFDTGRGVAWAAPAPVSASAAQPDPAAAAVTEAARTAAPTAAAPFLASAAAARQPVGWVANFAGNTVTPVDLVTRKAGPAIPAGLGPRRSSPPRTARPSTSPAAAPTPSPRSVRPPAARHPGPGRPRPLGAGCHAQRQDLVRGRQRLGHGHPGGDRVRAGQAGEAGRPIPVGRDPRASP